MFGTPLVAWWSRRNLSFRLLLSAGLTLFLCGGLLLYSTVQSAVGYERQNMADRLRDELESFSPLLAEQAVIGDYARIEQMLEMRVKRKNIIRAAWADSSGKPIMAKLDTAVVEAPLWFVSWVKLPPLEGATAVEVGGQSYGRLSMEITPAFAVNLIWSSFLKQLLILGAGFLAFFAVTVQLLRCGMRPLYSLAEGAERFGHGDYSLRIEPLAVPEILPSINAFNKMAREIETLLESMRKFSRAVEYSANSVVITNLQGEIEYVNPKFTQVTGYTREEAIGQNPRILKSGATSLDEYRNLWAMITAGDEWRGEFHNRRKDGSLYWESASISPIRNEKGEISHFIAVKEDISARKEVEAQLRRLNETLEQRVQEEAAKNREKDHLLIHQTRLTAMGEMIGNIAHQWRQPLNGLAILLVNLKDAQAYNEMSQAYLDETVDKAGELIHSMSATIDDFRNFFRPNREKMQFPLERAVRDALEMVEASFKDYNIEIVVRAEGHPQAMGFRNEYAQVVMNMLANAKDAILAQGVRHGRVEIDIACRGKQAYVSIRDNGGGIPQDIMGKIFDPYFTTRQQGSGVGLYMSKMMIENNMAGSIEVHNTPEGAEFLIVMPCCDVADAKVPA